jgi:LmbE family N-acetylglucosaminyl deacetylase
MVKISMRIIVVTAHPDDMEIACSGTLKKFQDEGAEIVSVVTVKPSAEVNSDRSKWIVDYELEQSYKLSGFELRVLDTELHPNGRPNLVSNNNTMTELNDLLEDCDLAIIPNPEDFHQDHRTTYELAWPLMQRKAREVWCMESWPYSYQYQKNTANMYIGIDWNFKQNLLQCYDSYITTDKLEQIRNLSRVYGDKSGNMDAEAFTLRYKYVR